jgi:hypothetical protein
MDALRKTKVPSCRRRYRPRSYRSSSGRLGAAIPLPKGVSPPVTEVGLSGLTTLLISRENELGLRGSPRGGPSEGRAGNERDQRESGEKRLHHISPCLWTFVIFLQQRRPTPCALYSPRKQARRIPEVNRSAPRSDQLYLWIYGITQRLKALYFGFGSSRYCLSFDLGSARPVCHVVQNRCGAAATRIEIFRQR